MYQEPEPDIDFQSYAPGARHYWARGRQGNKVERNGKPDL